MKIALFADLHANLEALEACLRHAARQDVEAHAFLGDLVGYGADPEAVVDLVREHARRGAIVVKGNHDEAAVAGDGDMNPDAIAAIAWTRERLSDGARRFLTELPLIVERDQACFVHASANTPESWEYVSDDIAAARSLAAVDSTWTFCGHVHDQALHYQGAGRRLMTFRPVPGVPIPVGRHRRWLATVGSCGQPRDGNTAAAYAIFDASKARLTFHRVPYDHLAAAAKIRRAGLPESLATRIEKG